MKEFFIELFEYGSHYNQILGQYILEHEKEIPKRSRELFCHILTAHNIWNNRITGEVSNHGVWEKLDSKIFSKLDNQNLTETLTIIHNADLLTPICYLNSKRVEYENTVKEILFHVVNHSTYHRGQIAMDFRNHKIQPLVTDYIAYKR